MESWKTFEHAIEVGDADRLAAAGEALFGWGIQRGAGLRVVGASRAELGAHATVLIGPRPLAVRAPVEVIETLSTDTVRSFTYRALPPHPEEGDETFGFDVRDGRLWFVVRARSRPRHRWGRLLRPGVEAVQWAVTRRYVAVARRLGR